jgi:hypothetical protein
VGHDLAVFATIAVSRLARGDEKADLVSRSKEGT